MANIQNLKPFKKGADPRRNLSGRKPIRDQVTLKEFLLDYLNEPTSKNEIRLMKHVKKMERSQRGLEVLWAYGLGKVPDKVDVTSNGEKIGTDASTIDRAVSSLADALREIIPGKGTE